MLHLLLAANRKHVDLGCSSAKRGGYESGYESSNPHSIRSQALGSWFSVANRVREGCSVAAIPIIYIGGVISGVLLPPPFIDKEHLTTLVMEPLAGEHHLLSYSSLR
jgi:hypothetical protein